MSLKDLKKGDSVILKGFTGMKLGVFEIAKAKEKSVTIVKKDGTEAVFSRKTGLQTNIEEGKEKYACSIMEDDGSYVAPVRKKAAPKKKSKKDEDDEEDEAPKAKSKKAAKGKKAKKEEVVEEPEEDEDDDDFEDEDEE